MQRGVGEGGREGTVTVDDVVFAGEQCSVDGLATSRGPEQYDAGRVRGVGARTTADECHH